jgi:hypothetical protein
MLIGKSIFGTAGGSLRAACGTDVGGTGQSGCCRGEGDSVAEGLELAETSEADLLEWTPC